MSSAAQKRAIQNYRARLTQRGYKRFGTAARLVGWHSHPVSFDAPHAIDLTFAALQHKQWRDRGPGLRD
ncbi:hypothetical protein [Sinorhizobium sp. NFACC03]|uniref:hypothetical protein n=1 Tax=Sinorhizobium sp. NFACC03 TaxID=1566295 RepID=UPI00087FACCF|nr:hypothetical protein [Sinorhizobium sp. NFACC03]SDA99629.1 hypothetical protein SAMN03159448_06638 [Sinorhizobium sp. NFACC03]